MKRQKSGIYFDEQDREILVLVNRLLESRSGMEEGIFDPNLHPHGIKEMVATPAARMACAVINLLRNLETGDTQARDRLVALRTLYTEVMCSATSSLRRNTARVLMQIMKDMVRAHGQSLEQLKLAHDFRKTAQGTPRVVRRMLARYHLPEMPEEWNQLAFDHHVYDVNTRGRKTPTHLIMDAWIKGIRALTVAYEYAIDADSSRELLEAAAITGIEVRIGLEFQVPFYDRFVSMLWIPRGFASNDDFLDFLQSPRLTEFMESGGDVLGWNTQRMLGLLHCWNEGPRLQLAHDWQADIHPLSDEAFLQFVGRGHPTRQHMSECLHQHLMPVFRQRAAALADRQDEEARAELKFLNQISPEFILDEWLSPAKHPELPDLSKPGPREKLPFLLRLEPLELVTALQGINPGYRLVLGTAGLEVEDVLELLWICQGGITHLEVFNMKYWAEGKMGNMEGIGQLQRALAQGKGPLVKQMVHRIIARLEKGGQTKRAARFRDILLNVPTLWEYYRTTPLKSRMGSGSASRGSYGMGLILRETMPRKEQIAASRQQQRMMPIPIFSPVEEHISFREPENPSLWHKLLAMLRFLPGCAHLGMLRQRDWSSASEDCHVCRHGNVINLGGLGTSTDNGLLEQAAPTAAQPLGQAYLNSTFSNCVKVLLGFIPACLSFHYTQSWWFLAWFGPLIWFGITGVRNVIQMVVAAMGATRGTLIHWKGQVSVSRICDSLMYTGFSVLLLEVLVRVVLLQEGLGITPKEHPLLVFTCISAVNGLYICSHNIFRGFPKTAAVGNLFRSVLAIPVASTYNFLLLHLLALMGVADPMLYLAPAATVIAKTASDTVAAVIEGYADSRVNLRRRRLDYRDKLARLFANYTRLELLFPQEEMLAKLALEGGLAGKGGEQGRELERAFIANALDLLYIWYYQPRAQAAFVQVVRAMPEVERRVLVRSQLVLLREREISQMLVDGLLGRDFSRPLAFFLENRKSYLANLTRVCRQARAHDRHGGKGA